MLNKNVCIHSGYPVKKICTQYLFNLFKARGNILNSISRKKANAFYPIHSVLVSLNEVMRSLSIFAKVTYIGEFQIHNTCRAFNAEKEKREAKHNNGTVAKGRE